MTRLLSCIILLMSHQHSIIFCGTPKFAVPSLRALLDDPAFEVTMVITQPDRKVGRKQIMTAPPVKILALERGIPVLQPEDINRETLPRTDFLVVVAYGKILKQSVLDLPTVAAINVHASLLPRWRGASPIEHAIMAGDTETGVTIQVMSEKLDAGPVLARKEIRLKMQDTSLMLRKELSELGAELLVAALKKPLHPVPQPTEGITICKKLSRADSIVDHTALPAVEIDRRVRALNPWPGVRITIENQELKILETSLTEAKNTIPVSCAQSTTLHLVRVQVPGRKAVSGMHWKIGSRFVHQSK